MSGREDGLERQRGSVDPLGFGVFATQDFREGDYICQYEGDWMHPDAADYFVEKGLRSPEYQMWVNKYVGGKLNTFVVDASRSLWEKTMGRNINHSIPDANVVQRLFVSVKHNYMAIYFKAIRDIKKGEEILYNYGDTRYGTTLGKWSPMIYKQGRAAYRRTCVSLEDDGNDLFRC